MSVERDRDLSDGIVAPDATDALTDRVKAWLGVALTKAKVRPVPDTDLFTGSSWARE